MSYRMKTLLYGVLVLLLWGGPPGAGAQPAPIAAATSVPVPTPTPYKVLPPLQGGLWGDEFLGWDDLACSDTVDIGEGSLYLKYAELLDWEQTWTAHFVPGAFYHTVAVSDSVQLAGILGTGQYYTTGVYTSTVFDAGRSVDWAWARWRYSGLPQSVTVECRTGNSLHPDAAWSPWIALVWAVPPSHLCEYSIDEFATDCTSTLPEAPSGRYWQYRCTLHSEDAQQTVALWDITLTYGTHYTQGRAVSIPLEPVDVRAWQTVAYSATAPAGATLQVDILDGAGDCDAPVLLADVRPGASLAALDPMPYHALRLRATLHTEDPSLSPILDSWKLRWEVGSRLVLPLVMRDR